MKSPSEIPENSGKRKLEDLDAGSLRRGGREISRSLNDTKTVWIDGNESNDPWKIKKTLKHSDCDRLYRLTLCKDMVQNHIIKVWEEAGKVDEIVKVESDEGVAVKVWDYEREKECVLKLKKLSFQQELCS
ncbi:hypothetical protein ACET3Z_021585 [Daucus carota]